MSDPITDTINTIQTTINNPSGIFNELKGLVSSINITPNIVNPTIDLSNSPYIKYGIIGIALLAIWFLFFNKKTKVA